MARSGDKSASGTLAAGRHITIKDVAEDLGLSITTISRALNGYPDVGEATRKRVTEAAQRLKLSARAYTRMLRVARTLADLEGGGTVTRIHVAEALSYRRIHRH